MSQSNKSKKTFYLLLFFTIICVGVTIACIYNTLQIRENNKLGQIDTVSETEKEAVTESNPEQISLTKKYLSNGITVETNSYKEGNIIYEWDDGTDPIYEYEISYEQISGLKNITVQNKINEEIKNQVLSLKDKLDENPNFNRISITSDVYGNFADVLSVGIDCVLIQQNFDDEDSTYEYKNYYVGLNYRLDNGEQLKFSDLFMKTTNIKQIIEKAAYEACAWDHAFSDEENFDFDFENTDYGYIENQVLKIVSAYNRNPDIEFYFSSQYIWAEINDELITIDMKECYEDIAIYTAYSKSNLYADTSSQKEFYPFTNTYLIECFEEEKVKGNNFYYEVITYSSNDENTSDVRNVVQKKIQDKIDYYYEIAKQNPDKAYMLSIIYFYSETEMYPISYNYYGYVSEMDFNYFKEHREEIISTARRTERGELWCYDFSECDENVEFYEEFSKYAEDYQLDDGTEEVFTKADREAQELEYLEEEDS